VTDDVRIRLVTRGEWERLRDLRLRLGRIVGETVQLDARQIRAVLRRRGQVLHDRLEDGVRLLPLLLAEPAGADFTRDRESVVLGHRPVGRAGTCPGRRPPARLVPLARGRGERREQEEGAPARRDVS
jgi:hypothetical protein